MKRPVLLTISAFTTLDSEKQDDQIDLLTTGTWTETEGGCILHYAESVDEESPPQQVELHVEESGVTMRRGGEYETQMVFRKAQRYEGVYRTPYGDMDMAIYATRLHHRADEKGGRVSLQYQLELSGQYAAMHDMTVQYVFKEGEA